MFISMNTALTCYNNFMSHSKKQTSALARLSSGKRINSAADDPAGMAISQRMRAQITQLQRERLNVMDAVSVTEIADGGYGSMQDILRRMQELALQSANGIYGSSDRSKLESEYEELLKSLDSVSGSIGNQLGSLFGKGRTSGSEPSGETISFSGGNLEAYLDGLDGLLSQISIAARQGDTLALEKLGISSLDGLSDSEKLHSAIIQFTKENAELLLRRSASGGASSEDGSDQFTVIISGGTISIQFQQATSDKLGLTGTSLKDAASSEKALDAIRKAMSTVSGYRSGMGAAQNRLEHTINSINRMEENLTASVSRITDADMAKEMMNYVKASVLSQVAMYTMAHAMQEPELTLRLLRQSVPGE